MRNPEKIIQKRMECVEIQRNLSRNRKLDIGAAGWTELMRQETYIFEDCYGEVRIVRMREIVVCFLTLRLTGDSCNRLKDEYVDVRVVVVMLSFVNENGNDHVISSDHGMPLLIYVDGSDMMAISVEE